MNFLPIHTLAVWNTSNFLVGLTVVGFGALCVLLVLAILIQKPQGGGLSGAFGAGASGSGQTAFGTKTGDALTWMTIIIFVVYLGAAIGMNYAMRPAATPASGGTASAPPAATPADSKTPAKAPAPNSDKPAAPSDKPAEKPADKTETTPPASSTINVKPAEPPATNPVAPAPTATPPAATPPATNPPAPPATTPK
jgi:preprotein translocase subunit SecG